MYEAELFHLILYDIMKSISMNSGYSVVFCSVGFSLKAQDVPGSDKTLKQVKQALPVSIALLNAAVVFYVFVCI